jgi:hypothetical protein
MEINPNPDPKPTLKRVLLVGINYTSARNKQNVLYGCVNDVRNVEERLRKTNPGAEYRVLHDEGGTWPSRANIMAAMRWLVSGLVSGDSVYYHYSGHGVLSVDRSGDEVSGLDSCICPLATTGAIEYITDDELRKNVVDAVPAGCTLTAVFDCCHSGTCLDLRYGMKSTETATVLTENRKYAQTKGQVFFLSGCMDTQTSADTVNAMGAPTGALTNAVLAVIDESAKINRFLGNVRKWLRTNGYDQVPQLSCGRSMSVDAPFMGRAGSLRAA